MKFRTLRLILGDQLNADHSWFKSSDEDTLYLIAELKQETDYTRHHIQKVCAFFAAMERFAKELQQRGHTVRHLVLDDTCDFSDLPELLRHYCKQHSCERFEYQRPDEYRLRKQLSEFAEALALETREVDTEHFLLPFDEINDYFSAQKHVRMENFYRKMRQRFDVLMEGDEPLGGQWNFDSDNRQSFKAADIETLPKPLGFANDVSAILKRLENHEVQTIGKAEAMLLWPVSRAQARELLSFFCQQLLPRFGQFQDAMTCQSEHSWSLYHSRLSFALNAKILHPAEVIDAAIAAYHESEQDIELSQVEGFVRQILGWREYVRSIYWRNMPGYDKQNFLQASRPLPEWFWTGETNMACMRAAITQSLDYAYAHHIQRLMLTGNFALLAGLDPDQVDQWYLGIYIDAIEWVELPNTRGMALFADGGWIATKPYAASANYINKMSDYCGTCAYSPKHKLEQNACPFNSLYWHFIDRNVATLKGNPRMAFPLKNWNRQSEAQKQDIRNKAQVLLETINTL